MAESRWFLILSLLFGFILCIITPPFQSPDEYNHFFRAVGIANGDILPTKVEKTKIGEVYINFIGMNAEASDYYVGSYIQADLVNLARNMSSNLPGNTKNKQDLSALKEETVSRSVDKTKIFVSYPNTALYSPVPYIPSSIVVLLGHLFKLNYLVIFYLARIINLSTYTVLIYLGIKNAPFLKFTLYLLALMPMSIFLGMSITTDSIVIALSILVFSLLCKLCIKYDRNVFTYLILISFLLGASKSAYFILPFSSIILLTRYKKPKLLLPLLGSCAGFLVWSLLSKDLYVPLRNGVDPFVQGRYILKGPYEFVCVFINTVIGNRRYIINQFVGNLGWLDVPLNIHLSYLYTLLLIFSSTSEETFLSRCSKIINFIVAGTSFLLISIIMYLSWTPVGHQEILGLVGKNFIPISVFGLASISSIIKLKRKKIVKKIILLLPIPILIYTIYKIISRYYLG